MTRRSSFFLTRSTDPIDTTYILLTHTISYFGLPGRALLCLGRYLFLPLIPRLCLTIFSSRQPSLATELVRYLEDDYTPESYGYEIWLSRSQPIQLLAVKAFGLVEERHSAWYISSSLLPV